MEEILDRENKRMADSLASKVTRLKSVSGGPLLLPSPGIWRGVSAGGKDLDGFQVVPFSLSHLWHTHLCEAQVAFGSSDLC